MMLRNENEGALEELKPMSRIPHSRDLPALTECLKWMYEADISIPGEILLRKLRDVTKYD